MGWCRFASEECWFLHEGEKSDIQNTNMIQRLFNMMEVYGEKIAFMESQM